MSSLPKVLILGRANVGKSTLFNRLSSTRQALVSPRSGTTRDRKETVVSWSGKEVTLVDSGGLDVNTQDPIEREIAKQALKGLQESDLILFVVDTKVGITPQDTEIATWLRKQKAQVIVVANKADSLKWRQASAEFQKFGLGDPLPVSAANGSGTGDLLDEVMKLAKASNVKEVSTIKVAIIGKPNVGKSSLINSLVNDERVIVSPQAHTTRDSHDVEMRYHDQSFTFIDTAGISREKFRHDEFKNISMDQARASIERADVVIFMTEANEPLNFQDKHLGDIIVATGASVVLVGNKWDLIEKKDTMANKKLTDAYRRFFQWLHWAPLLFISAKQKTKRRQLLDHITQVYQERSRKIDDNACDKFLKHMLTNHGPSKGSGTRHPYIYHFRQMGVNPPTFEVKIKYKTDLHSSYLKYLEKGLREKFGFTGTPIKIYVSKITNA